MDQADADGGVTSALGFRIVVGDGMDVGIFDAESARRFVAPHEAEEQARARRRAEKAQERASKAQQLAEKAQERATKAQEPAERKAGAEAASRQEAEAKVKELEEELRRLRNKK